MSDQPDKMDLHEFRASRSRKTANLLKEDHRDLKRFFALDSAAYRDGTAEGGLDEKIKELLGLVASTVLRCNDCIAYHCDQCVQVGWKKEELLDALNVALVIGGSITIPHIRTVWEVVEQLFEEKELQHRAKEGHPGLQAAAKEVRANVVERDSDAIATLGLPPEAHSRKARAAKKTETPVAPMAVAPAAIPPPAKAPIKPKAPVIAAAAEAKAAIPPAQTSSLPPPIPTRPSESAAPIVEVRPDARATRDPAHAPKAKPAPPASAKVDAKLDKRSSGVEK